MFKAFLPTNLSRRDLTRGVLLVVVGVFLGLAAVKVKHAINMPELKRSWATMTKGGDSYVQARLDKEGEPAAAGTLLSRSIDTSRLPLLLQELPLTDTRGFPSGPGGAIAKVGDKLIVLDRLGGIFALENEKPRKLDYGLFPSNLRDYIKSSPASTESLLYFRTHHIVYDPKRSVLYVTLERYNSESKKIRFVLAELPIDRQTLEKRGEWRILFESSDLVHAPGGFGGGGGIALSGDLIYFAVGDWSTENVPERQDQLVAQDPKSPFGKTYELNLASGKVRMKSSGHRNPQGMVLTTDNRLFALEQGPQGGDELNLIQDSANYGWPYKTLGVQYGTFTWPIKLRPPTGAQFTEPVFAFVPSVATSSVIQISSFSDRWKGDLLVSSLKAQSLFRLHTEGGRIVYSEPIWVGSRIRDLVEIGDRIVLLTDKPSLIYVDIDQPRTVSNVHSGNDLNPVLTQCMTCHHLGPTNTTHQAPSLTNIVGRKIAGGDFANYSEALLAKGGKWDKDAIASFIRDPSAFAPGSTMPAQAVTEKQANLIAEVLAQ